MSRSIRFVIARRKSQSNCYFKFLPAISLFCLLFHFFAHYFNKNSKTTSQSDLRNNAWHVIKWRINCDLLFCGSSYCFGWFNKETLWPLRNLETFSLRSPSYLHSLGSYASAMSSNAFCIIPSRYI